MVKADQSIIFAKVGLATRPSIARRQFQTSFFFGLWSLGEIGGLDIPKKTRWGRAQRAAIGNSYLMLFIVVAASQFLVSQSDFLMNKTLLCKEVGELSPRSKLSKGPCMDLSLHVPNVYRKVVFN